MQAQVALGCAKLTSGPGAAQQHTLEPAGDPWHYCYPGHGLLSQILDRACRLVGKGRLDVRQAVHLVGACGELLYMPDAAALEALLAGATGDVATFMVPCWLALVAKAGCMCLC